MLDRYWHGNTNRISPEAPVPVVHVNIVEERPGGAGNVALNIAALGAKPIVLGFCGEDEAADVLINSLKQVDVECQIRQFDYLSTITKLRVLSRHQQLIRLDLEDSFHEIPANILIEDIKNHLSQANVIVLSDYGKGTLSSVQEVIELARNAGKSILVDPKGNDFTIYKGATLITPNISEFEAVAGRCSTQSDIVEKATNLIDTLDLQALLVTRGENGMNLISRSQAPIHLPTQAREVYDVTGAGDTVISILAANLAAKTSLTDAIHLSNIGAGIVVGKLGTATVTRDELNDALHSSRAHHRGVTHLFNLLKLLEDARSKGEKIVTTNGCFDILHPGHIRYLAQAKKLGDRLIVLVNSDDSVCRLKGPDRPINPLPHRMEMLAALECVDWVIPFDADTPENVICRILPDVLVKGGDYQDASEIAGCQCVQKNGGEVKILNYVDGFSTSRFIDSMRHSDKTPDR